MNILHITDFHYSEETKALTDVVSAIVEALGRLTEKIDFVLFTGDLVQNGSIKDDYSKAANVLFQPIFKALGLEEDRLLMCPGNHDIDRTKIYPSLFNEINNAISNEVIDSFYKRKDQLYQDSLAPHANYIEFMRTRIGITEENTNPLYSIQYKQYNDEKVAFVSINTAWLSDIGNHRSILSSVSSVLVGDKDNLLYPLAALEEIRRELRQSRSKYKVLLAHHPLYFLKDMNQFEVENFVYGEFDAVFYGHIHKVGSRMTGNGVSGIFEHYAKASLTSKENLGCTIVNISDDFTEYGVRELTYVLDGKVCVETSKVVYSLPQGEEKQRQSQLRKKVHERISIELEDANKLMLENEIEAKNFLYQFSDPILKTTMEGSTSSSELGERIDWHSMLSENNYIVRGKDKCGKTSLLKRLLLEYLTNYSSYSYIPLYVDAREYEVRMTDNFDFLHEIRSLYGLNRRSVEQLEEEGRIIFLIDNLSLSMYFAKVFGNYINTHENIRYVCCAEYNYISNFDNDISELGYENYQNLYIQDLRRKEIVLYTQKHLQGTALDAQELEEKIVRLCKQMDLPLNFWTISLLLLIHKRSTDTYSKNIYGILDMCVDEILEKKKLVLANAAVNLDLIKAICGDLAKQLFLKEAKNVFSANEDTIKGYIQSYLEQNPRIVLSREVIFDFIYKCGILKQKEGGAFTFRLQGFFEYFLALKMVKEIDFRSYIINDPKLYLTFKNQLEIYSGFKRDDKEFLDTIKAITEAKVKELFAPYLKDVDGILERRIQLPQKIKDKCKELTSTSLNYGQTASIEDMMDELQINAEVKEMPTYDPQESSPNIIDRYISIYARVFKNTDQIIDEENYVQHTFSQLLDYYCAWSFFLIDSYCEKTIDEFKTFGLELDESQALKLWQLVTTMIPIVAQVNMFDGLGHSSIETLAKTEIEECEKDIASNQYKLFMLYFLMLDIDCELNDEYFDKVVNNISSAVLRYMALLKFNYYLVFKSHNKKTLQHRLQILVQNQKLSLDKKTNIDELQRVIQQQKRKAVVASYKQ
jgi:DNA repair exonuclease SbcCD nuclease subunit